MSLSVEHGIHNYFSRGYFVLGSGNPVTIDTKSAAIKGQRRTQTMDEILA